MPYVSFDSFFGTLQHMGPALWALKVGKCNFWEIQNARLWPNSSPKKKVQKTKKFCLIELQLECAKIFGLRSNPGELWPKNHFSGIWPFEADLRQRRPFNAHFPTLWRFFWQFLDSNLFSMHRREYVPIFIWIGCSGECLGRGGRIRPPRHLDMLLRAVANRVKSIFKSLSI